MKEIIDKGIKIKVNVIETKKIYDAPDFYICECSYCRNFYKTIKDHVPNDFQKLLKSLGIEILKPSEAVENGRINERNLYIVDYHFFGEIDNSTLPKKELNHDIFDYQYFPNDYSLASKKFDVNPVVALRISVPLPWVLKEKYE